MLSAPTRLRRDPRVTTAPPEAVLVYLQIYKMPELRPAEGCDLVGLITSLCALLGPDPRGLVERAVKDLLARELLVATGDGAHVPRHAPTPPRPIVHAHGRGLATAPRRATERPPLPEGVSAGDEQRFWRNFAAWKCRLSDAEKALPEAELVEKYLASPRHSRPRGRLGAAVVTAPSPRDVTAPVTHSPVGVTAAATTAVTSVSEGVGEEKELVSLSSSRVPEETTSQSPRAHDPDVTAVVTDAAVTTPVTTDGAPPAAGQRLSPAAVWNALSLERTNRRLGTTGKHHRRRAFELLIEENVAQADVEGIASLARQRKLFGLERNAATGEQRDQVSLAWALSGDAKVFLTWIDQGRGEAARQVELGIAANDARTGASRAALPTAPRAGPSTLAAPVTMTPLAPGQISAGLSFGARARAG